MLSNVPEMFAFSHNKLVAISNLDKYVGTVYPIIFIHINTSESGCSLTSRLSLLPPGTSFPARCSSIPTPPKIVTNVASENCTKEANTTDNRTYLVT